VITPSETSTLTTFQSNGTPGALRSSQPESAARAALTASETSNRKPIATTRPNDRTRSSRNALKFIPGFGVTRQIVLSAA
jgi:hypothetical protein